MAKPLELEDRSEPIPHSDLREKGVVENLIKQGRTPTFNRVGIVDGVMQGIPQIQCLIPGSEKSPAETFQLSLEDTRAIIAIREKLRLHH